MDVNEVKPKIRVKRNKIQRNQPKFRRRMRPVRRWKITENNALINFLLDNPDFEKPTQRLYYQDFIRQHRIDIPWDLIKEKVRNLRIKYEKLKKLYKCNENGGVNDKRIAAMERCGPNFNILTTIFAKRVSTDGSPLKADNSVSQNPNNMDQQSIRTTSIYSSDIIHPFTTLEPHFSEVSKHPISTTTGQPPTPIKDEIIWATEITLEPNQIINKHGLVTTTMNSENVMNSVNATIFPLRQDLNSAMTAIPIQQQPSIITVTKKCTTPIPVPIVDTQQQDLEILKINFEKEKFLRRMTLREKKFEFSMEKTRKRYELRSIELNLEKIKVETDSSLRRQQLEIDERIAMKKLEIQQRRTDCEI